MKWKDSQRWSAFGSDISRGLGPRALVRGSDSLLDLKSEPLHAKHRTQKRRA
jgi:hypothetical protein